MKLSSVHHIAIIVSDYEKAKELSDENSKLWHYSAMTLYTMYQDELLTGSYDYPEEA
ncbi:MAG: hypothetical protein Q4C97_11780 [Bacillota bacterium]|nr:hypothetical protein [Bacillota bacterium]